MKKLITNDVFKISYRLKQIDKKYEVYFNYFKNEYEIDFNQQLCFFVGKILDKRVLDKVYLTNIRNFDFLFTNMQQTNEKLEVKEKTKLKNLTHTLLNDFTSYADKVGEDCSFENAMTTRWF